MGHGIGTINPNLHGLIKFWSYQLWQTFEKWWKICDNNNKDEDTILNKYKDNNSYLKNSDKILFIIFIILLLVMIANGPGDLGSIPGRVIPKTLKMVLDTTLLNTQHYKVRFKGKVEQSWEWSSALPYTLV